MDRNLSRQSILHELNGKFKNAVQFAFIYSIDMFVCKFAVVRNNILGISQVLILLLTSYVTLVKLIDPSTRFPFPTLFTLQAEVGIQ